MNKYKNLDAADGARVDRLFNNMEAVWKDEDNYHIGRHNELSCLIAEIRAMVDEAVAAERARTDKALTALRAYAENTDVLLSAARGAMLTRERLAAIIEAACDALVTTGAPMTATQLWELAEPLRVELPNTGAFQAYLQDGGYDTWVRNAQEERDAQEGGTA